MRNLLAAKLQHRQHVLYPDLVRRNLLREVFTYLVVAQVKYLARLRAAVNRIDNQKPPRSCDEMCKLHAECPAVNQSHVVGEGKIFLQIFDDTHAEALITQDNVANAQHRIFRRE